MGPAMNCERSALGRMAISYQSRTRSSFIIGSKEKHKIEANVGGS